MTYLKQIKAILIGTFLLLFILAPVCLIAIFFPLKWRLKIVSPAWKIFGKGIMRYACQAYIDIHEDHRSEEFKKVPGQGLYIANHQSFIDIPLMATIHQIPPIMKKEVLYIPILGPVAWASGAMPVSRSKNDSRKKVFAETKKRLVRQNIAVQVYPEGTRSKDGHPKPLNEIKKTLLLFAYNENVPVIATSMYGSRGVLNKKGFIQPGRHVGIIVHKEIFPTDYKSSEEFIEAAWNKVIEGHDLMMNQIAPLG